MLDEKRMRALRAAGVDTDDALSRFCNNTALYERFLLKFPEDRNYEKIKPALDTGDMKTALTVAHTLKGVSGNLGFKDIYLVCADIVNAIRNEKYDEARDSYCRLRDAYEAVSSVLADAGEEEG